MVVGDRAPARTISHQTTNFVTRKSPMVQSFPGYLAHVYDVCGTCDLLGGLPGGLHSRVLVL